VLDAGTLERAVEQALARIGDGRERNQARRAKLERERQAVQKGIDRLIDAIQDGSLPMDDIKARLAAETARRKALTAELESTSAVVSIDAQKVRRELHALVGDVKGLLAESTQQARGMLRKLLDGPLTCQPYDDEVNGKGYFFAGMLTSAKLISGEALTSLAGTKGCQSQAP
jgi:hypothetical protein